MPVEEPSNVMPTSGGPENTEAMDPAAARNDELNARDRVFVFGVLFLFIFAGYTEIIKPSIFTLPKYKYKYDVFLCFRGPDERSKFVSNLEHRLDKEAKIKAFIDHKLPRGKPITVGLVEAIKSSRVGLIIFSKDFASSTDCLDEVAEMMDEIGVRDMVIPVFYEIEPNDVWFQNGSFTDAFKRHKETYACKPYKVQRWINALTRTAGRAGYPSSIYRTDSQMIDAILDDVKAKLKEKPSDWEPEIDLWYKIFRLVPAFFRAFLSACKRFYEELSIYL